jgi:hypothetical protein
MFLLPGNYKSLITAYGKDQNSLFILPVIIISCSCN